MPASINQQSIPVPTPDNLLQVVNAIRNVVISGSNTAAGRAGVGGQLTQPTSQFVLQSEIIVPVTYTASDGKTVTINQLISLTLVNQSTGQTWTWTAPANLTRGGVQGQPLS